MYRQTLTLEREIGIPFTALKSGLDRVIGCIPRVASIEHRPDGSAKIRLEPIQATPLIKVRACGWVQLVESDDAIIWQPRQCSESNGCVSGEARPGSEPGTTRIQVTINIFAQHLPALPVPGQTIIAAYITRWADQLLSEFVTAWHQQETD